MSDIMGFTCSILDTLMILVTGPNGNVNVTNSVTFEPITETPAEV